MDTGTIRDANFTVNIAAVRTVLENPCYRLYAGRYGLRAQSEDSLAFPPSLSAMAIVELLEKGFEAPAEIVLSRQPEEAIHWLQRCIEEARKPEYLLDRLVARHGRVYAKY